MKDLWVSEIDGRFFFYSNLTSNALTNQNWQEIENCPTMDGELVCPIMAGVPVCLYCWQNIQCLPGKLTNSLLFTRWKAQLSVRKLIANRKRNGFLTELKHIWSCKFVDPFCVKFHLGQSRTNPPLFSFTRWKRSCQAKKKKRNGNNGFLTEFKNRWSCKLGPSHLKIKNK